MSSWYDKVLESLDSLKETSQDNSKVMKSILDNLQSLITVNEISKRHLDYLKNLNIGLQNRLETLNKIEDISKLHLNRVKRELVSGIDIYKAHRDRLALTIPSGNTVSNIVDIGAGMSILGLEIPTITTAVVYLQAATAENGTFRRILKPDGSGDWNIASSAGDKMIFIDIAAPFQFFKVETSITQDSDCAFYLVSQA